MLDAEMEVKKMKKSALRIMLFVMAALMAVSACVYATGTSPVSTAETKSIQKTEVKMVPMIKTAEVLGFDVIAMKLLKKGEYRYCLDNRKKEAVITVGKDRYQISNIGKKNGKKGKTFSLGTAPVIRDGEVYVPVEVFCRLLGCAAEEILTEVDEGIVAGENADK